MLPHVYEANGITPLTAQEEKFVREYMVDENALKAACRAGYSQRLRTT